MINFVYSDDFLRFWMRMSSKRKRSQTVARKSAAVVRIIRIVGRGGTAFRTEAVGGASRELDSASGTFCERQVFVRTCCASAEFE